MVKFEIALGTILILAFTGPAALSKTQSYERCLQEVQAQLPKESQERSNAEISNIYYQQIRNSELTEPEGSKAARLRSFRNSEQDKRPILIVPGFKEASSKYAEMADDLIRFGYGPIYVLDHRGQGAAGPYHPNRKISLRGGQKAHPSDIGSFDQMAEDLNRMIQKIGMETGVSPQLIAHSMGTVVVMRAAQLFKDNFKAKGIVLSAPVFKIHNVRNPNIFRDALNSDRRKAWRICKAASPLETKDCLLCLSNSPDVPDDVTSHQHRFLFGQPADKNPLGEQAMQFRLCGTLSFLDKYNSARQEMMKAENLELIKSSSFSLRVILAAEDTYVDNSEARKVCNSFGSKCQVTEVQSPPQKCQHELFIESDACRSQAIAAAVCQLRIENPKDSP